MRIFQRGSTKRGDANTFLLFAARMTLGVFENVKPRSRLVTKTKEMMPPNHNLADKLP